MTIQNTQPAQPKSIAELRNAVAAVRRRVPLLNTATVNGHPLAYLDSGATAQRTQAVIDRVNHYVMRENAAVHRGAHTLAALATEAFEGARADVATFIGAAEDELTWTSGATESLNLVAYALTNASLGLGGANAARFAIRPGDSIVVTELEHHANLIPWQQLAARTGAELRFVPIDDDGHLQLDSIPALIDQTTKVVASTHVSNVIGEIVPVGPLIAAAHAVGAIFVLDGCQSVPHLPIDVKALDVDFLAFSGHKMLGPSGIGCLYGKAELLDALPPFLTGGSMITHVDMQHAEFLPAPQKFEAGTKQVPQAVGLATAVHELEQFGMENVVAWEAHLGQRMVDGLASIDGVRIMGPGHGEERMGLVSFVVEGIHAHDAGQVLDDAGIAVRVGHHCAQPLHRRLGVTATVRASSYLYTTEDEVDRFLDAVQRVPSVFGGTR